MSTLNRTGRLQHIKRRGYKRSSELSIWKHLAFIWGGGLIVWPTFTAILAYNILPNDEALVLTFIVVMANLFVGWIPALFIFLLNWGIRGWIETAREFKTTRTRLSAEADEAALYQASLPATPLDSTTLTDDEIMTQWKALNPYGCCMDNRDAQGYPCHGGPDCQHPDLY